MSSFDWGTVLGSATAGLFGRLICHPFDTIKAQLQANSGSRQSLKSVALSIGQKEGIMGFYRGIGAALVGGMPACCLYLSSYSYVKDALATRSGSSLSPFLVYLISGMLAETISCVIFVPVDVIKERLQVQSINSKSIARYRHSWDALRTIVRTEGWRNGLYRGYGITLLSFGPFSALYFSFYERLKEFYFRNREVASVGSEVPFLPSLIMSAVAGSASSFITNPLDLVKLRIQIERRIMVETNAPGSGTGNVRGKLPLQEISVMPMLKKLWNNEGMVGMFRGAGARVIFHAPNTAITMALFETCQGWWKKVLGVAR